MSPEVSRRAALLPLVFMGLVLLYLLPMVPHPTWVPYLPNSSFTDLLISHLPNTVYWRDSLHRFGQWPLWNGQLFAGQPFAANPLAGLWYPPNWLLLLAPVPAAFNGLLALHLAWAGLGVYTFLRAEGIGPAGALLGGAAFAGTPKLIAHMGAGHFSLVCAVAWTPWLLLASRRAAHLGGLSRGALAGGLLALIFLADARWAFYAGALAGAYGLSARSDRAGRLHIRALVAFAALFFLVSAVLALPLAEFAAQSSRQALTLNEAGAFSLPPTYLLGLLIPNLGGFHEWMTYLGVVPLLLAVAGIGRRTWFWGAAALAAMCFALGSNFILFPLMFRLAPGAALLRVPPRAWFIVALSAAILAGYGLQVLIENWLPLLAKRYSAAKWRMPSSRASAGLALALTVLDLMRVDHSLIQMRPMPPVVPAAAWLAQQPGVLRVYSPSFSLPPGDGLQHLDGVDPLQLAEPVEYIERATGVTSDGYSVTVPAFCEGCSLATANRDAPLDAILLARLDVKYVAAEFPVTASGFELVQTFGATLVYLNTAWTGRARVEGSGEVTATTWTPNRVTVTATGPGRLVVSEMAYPGWRATIDGAPAAIETADGVFRAVTLPAGEHVVIFEFRPVTVFVGASLSLLGVVVLAALLWRERSRA
jgi:hypothetical protein